MSRYRFSASLFFIVGATLLWTSVGACQSDAPQPDSTDEAKPEYLEPQSPALPTPKGLKLIDQGIHDKRLAGFRMPEGFRLDIVAEQPAVVSPVGMAFADDGTPFVVESRPSAANELREYTETIKYKDGTTRSFPMFRKKKNDVVKVLSSSKNDGVFDRAKIVLEEQMISGILLSDGWLYLSGQGTVRRYRQSKSGGSYDVQAVIAQGFGGQGNASVSGMTLDNDGWLYISAGAADHHVEGSDGSRATVLRTGAIFRCRPDGSKLHTFALGLCNPHGDAAFDLGGNLFHIDCDVAGEGKFTGCRLMHVADQADLGWRLAPGSRTLPDHSLGAVAGELPGKMPPLLKTGRGEPSGLFICNDSRIPEEYRGLVFYADPYRQLIRAYKVEPSGASFKAVEEFSFLSSNKDESFRPCKMILGPDGAVYIVDRRTKATGDPQHGRIYRVRWSGTKDSPALPLRSLDSWAKIAKLDDKELIKTLSSEDASDRERARRELVKRGDKNREALVKLLPHEETALVAKIAALGALQSMFDASVKSAFENVLKDGDTELQRLAAEALGHCVNKSDRDANAALLQALSSEDLSVRRAVALAMGRLAGPGAGDNLAAALSFDESKDVFLRDGILRGLEMLGKPGIDALIALADSGVQKDTDRVVEAFLALRSRSAFAALPNLLKHMHVSSGQRVDLIRSTAGYAFDPPVSLDAIVAQITGDLKETHEVKKALVEVLGATPEGACRAGKLYLEKKLPVALREEVARALRKHAAKDPAAAKLLKEVMKGG